jgi:hypothetical protein
MGLLVVMHTWSIADFVKVDTNYFAINTCFCVSLVLKRCIWYNKHILTVNLHGYKFTL